MIKDTIPINLNEILYLDVEKAKEFGNFYSEIYKKAEEYPHIVIDNFLPMWMIEEIHNEYPTEQNFKDKLFETIFTGMHKRQVLPY